MKNALFVFSPIIIFGIAIYVYLRQEQDKFIPKDKYDEAWNEFYENTQPSHFALISSTLPYIFLGVLFIVSFQLIFTGFSFGLLAFILICLFLFAIYLLSKRETSSFFSLAFILFVFVSIIACCCYDVLSLDLSGLS
jgi:hypothetical protein